MVIVWLALLSVSVVIARYYRTVWTERKLLGQQVWFQVHGTVSYTSFVFTLIATGSIFYAMGGPEWPFSLKLYGHTYAGILTNIQIFSQVINSLLRCKPGHDKQWVFTWVHRVTGLAGLLLSVITMFLVSRITYLDMPFSFTIVLVIFVIVFGLLQASLEVDMFYLNRKNLLETATEEDGGEKVKFPLMMTIGLVVVLGVGTLVALIWSL